MKLKNFCVAILVIFFLNGCILVPFIDGVKKIGVTKSDREKLLKPIVERFQELVYWNKWEEAGHLIVQESRSKELRQILNRAKGFRLVDSKVDFIEYDKDSSNAVVDLTIRRYKVPFYVVEEFQEQQNWTFTISDGWKFVSVIEKNSNDKN
jgi:hypothetical protein